jgi:hypothetical protein
MVEFMGHALLLCRVGFDVDDVSHTVVYEESGELDRAVFCKTIETISLLQIPQTVHVLPLKPRLNIWRVRAL